MADKKRYLTKCKACGVERCLRWPPRGKTGYCKACAIRLRSTTRSDVSTDQLARDYESGMSLTEVARRHGLSYATVWERLESAGIPRRAPSMAKFRHDIDTTALVAEYEAGASSKELARKYGLSYAAVIERVRKGGGAVRPRLEAIQHRVKKLGHELERDERGRYILRCHICGAKRTYTQRPPMEDRKRPCPACAMKRRRGAGHAGYRADVDSRVLVREYRAGASLVTLAEKYHMTPRGVQLRIRASGEETRTWKEAGIHWSARCQGIAADQWRGYKSADGVRLLQSVEYKAWRAEVFDRDGYHCMLCGEGAHLEAHHIRRRQVYPEGTFDVANGVTLCRGCHRKLRHHEEEYEPTFRALLDHMACGVI